MTNEVFFTPDFLEFFKELAANNHKEWFDENRKRYEQSVKKPFENYVQAVIEEVRKIDPEVVITYKEAIFRINRDIRFSKDKAPYKLDRSAVISPLGRKDHTKPGFYLSLGPEKNWFGGGAYEMKSDQLQRLRESMAAKPGEIDKLIGDKKFASKFDEIKGDQHKRLPKEFTEAAETQPLLYKKRFYYMAEEKPELVLSDQLLPVTMEYFKASLPVMLYLRRAINS